ncbi:NiFe hydrogenase [Shewanella waksmanii]|uniref:Kae1-like domain-containing protein n=1 Tax=Shewanella waksmanii TaxID=213783 RepID=UPI003735CD84
MNIVKFEFVCSRPVPLYAHLCNHYLTSKQVDITVSFTDNCYLIEASGEQAQLEQLADDIAERFLVSAWLVDSSITLIEQRLGSKTPLPVEPMALAFCQECMPRFGDNQHADFANIALPCPHCQGEKRLNSDTLAASASDLRAMAKHLITHGKLTLGKDIVLSLKPSSVTARPSLLVCNPNTINAQFHLNDRQVLALSSIEKPYITARAIERHPSLDLPLYDLCFANSRILVIIAELLRQQGIDWVYIIEPQRPAPMAYINGAWVSVNQGNPNSDLSPLSITSSLDALHENSLISHGGYVYRGQHHQQRYQVSVEQQPKPLETQNLGDIEMGRCAFNSVLIEHQIEKHAAMVFFSEHHGGQIQTLDGKKQQQLFFTLPKLPQSGYEIFHQLEQSPQQTVLLKFKQQFPHDYLRLLDLKLPDNRQNLRCLHAVAALILGIETPQLSVDQLSDALVANALAHRGSNAPRVDFTLTRGEAHRSLNWCRMLGSLMSFRLADDTPNCQQRLAFGIHDSFADYLANWIEHLDQNVGVKAVALLGDEWQNSALTQRVQLRVGKNFKIITNQRLDIDGNNYAIGALRLNKRRL